MMDKPTKTSPDTFARIQPRFQKKSKSIDLAIGITKVPFTTHTTFAYIVIIAARQTLAERFLCGVKYASLPNQSL